MNPYVDNGSIRTFDTKVDPIDLVWHRDTEDRLITIIDGEGWQFQFDDQLPFNLNIGDKVHIPKMTYHRILKGQNCLTINIVESPK